MHTTLRGFTRFTPVATALAALRQACGERSPAEVSVPLAHALGRRAAKSVCNARPCPPTPAARYDGWATSAECTAGASPYNPMALGGQPVESGQSLPPASNVVIPLSALDWEGPTPWVQQEFAPGEGVIPAGGWLGEDAPLVQTGERLDGRHLALLHASGRDEIHVLPPLRVTLLPGSGVAAAGLAWMAARLTAHPDVHLEQAKVPHDEGRHYSDALRTAAPDSDLMVILGGSGWGASDHAAGALIAAGTCACHGLALQPGESAGVGHVGDTPVILCPGAPLAALAVEAVLIRPALAHLAGAPVPGPDRTVRLTGKITASVGVTTYTRLRITGDQATPLPTDHGLRLGSLADSNGYTVIPAESEGYSAGHTLTVFRDEV